MRIWVSIFLAVALASFAWSSGAARASSDFGDLYLIQGDCCSGAPIDGSRASITTPVSDYVVPSHECGLERTDVEGGTTYQTQDNRLIQTGIVECGSSFNLDGTCSTSQNLVYYTEVLWSDAFHCTPLGQAGFYKTHHFSAYSYNGDNVFYSAMDGAQDPTSGYYYATIPYVYFGMVSGELNNCNSKSTCDGQGSWSVYAYYDTNPPGPESALRWQRYNPSVGWVTIGAATPCNGAGIPYNCSGGGWDPLDPPVGPFTISYEN